MKLFPKKQPSRDRRRTLHTDFKKPQAFSYHAQRTPDNIANQQRRNATERAIDARPKAAKRSHPIQLVIVIILAATALFFITRLSTEPAVAVSGTIAGNVLTADQAAYQLAATKILSQSFTSQNKLTLNTTSFITQLKTEFPQIASATLSIPLVGSKMTLTITVTKAALVLQSGTSGYVIDQNGRIMASASQVANLSSLKLPIVSDPTTAGVLTNGTQALSMTTVQFITSVIYELNQKSITVKQLVLPDGSNELDVYPTGKTYYVKFNLQSNTPVNQAGTYLALNNYFTQRGITPASYVDVRVAGRGYYK
jgi:hypothetical protein